MEDIAIRHHVHINPLVEVDRVLHRVAMRLLVEDILIMLPVNIQQQVAVNQILHQDMRQL